MDAAKKTRLAELLTDPAAEARGSNPQTPASPDPDVLEDLVQEIRQDATARAGSYPRDTEVPEGGE
ncbi:MAG: hypothetical protein SX243_23275 [Acidobacteriota bacterium]|nr:hypothetical protein [Acidobacteriota bacterium]